MTRAEALRALRELEATGAELSSLTLAIYLEEHWLPGLRVAPGTASTYRMDLESKVIPALGALRLDRLRAEQIDALYRQLEARLAAKSIAHLHGCLHKALGDAVRRGLLLRNPASAVEAPKAHTRQMNAWTAEELRQFLREVREERLYALWLLLSMTGMRRGEALGCGWRTWRARPCASGGR